MGFRFLARAFGFIFLALPAGLAPLSIAQRLTGFEPQTEQLRSTASSGAMVFETQRCAEIAAMGPEYRSLGNTCEYVLSRKTFPNFLCQETMLRSMRTNPLKDWKSVDTVTATVTFVNGKGDRYSDFTINGRQVDSLVGSGGWNSLALFGSQLTTIFLPATKTDFKFSGKVNGEQGPSALFNFQFKRENNFTFKRGALRPGLSGSIFIDEPTGQLRHVEALASELDPNGHLLSYKSSLDYGDVAIPDLGMVLTPTAGRVEVCFMDGVCDQNVLSFHGCRKFGSDARIIPNPAP
jgi:hypothetical protein